MMRLSGIDALDMYSRPTVKPTFLRSEKVIKQFTTDASLDALQPRRV